MMNICKWCKKGKEEHGDAADEWFPYCKPKLFYIAEKMWGNHHMLRLFEPMTKLEYIEYQYEQNQNRAN